MKKRHTWLRTAKNHHELLTLLTWFACAVIIAAQRSYWGDELIRLTQAQNGFFIAFRDLFREPSPFAPGETLLNLIVRYAFSWLLPEEIWGRIPSISFGAGTLFLAFKLKKDFPLLPWLVFFSAPLMNLATEMRPYSSLFYCGAVSFAILWSKNLKTLRLHIWAALFFGHIYGICFVAFSCLLKRRLKEPLVGALYVGATLLMYDLQIKGSSPLPPLYDLIKQSLGSLGNPHKASLILGPVSALGAVILYLRNKKQALLIIFVFLLTVISPILASYRAGYFFSPRQVLAGSFFFLSFAAVGFEFLATRAKGLWPVVFLPILTATAVPWALSCVFKVPPFPNQPYHRFKQVAEQAIKDGHKKVILLEPCNEGPMSYYIEKRIGEKPESVRDFEIGGVGIEEKCWNDSKLCFYFLLEFIYCSTPPSDSLLKDLEQNFDFIIYSHEKYNEKSDKAKPNIVRSW